MVRCQSIGSNLIKNTDRQLVHCQPRFKIRLNTIVCFQIHAFLVSHTFQAIVYVYTHTYTIRLFHHKLQHTNKTKILHFGTRTVRTQFPRRTNEQYEYKDTFELNEQLFHSKLVVMATII